MNTYTATAYGETYTWKTKRTISHAVIIQCWDGSIRLVSTCSREDLAVKQLHRDLISGFATDGSVVPVQSIP